MISRVSNLKQVVYKGLIGSFVYLILCLITTEIIPHFTDIIPMELTVDQYRNFLLCFLTYGFLTFAIFEIYQRNIIKAEIILLIHYLVYIGGIVFMTYFLEIYPFDWYGMLLMINSTSFVYFILMFGIRFNDILMKKYDVHFKYLKGENYGRDYKSH